MQGHTICADDGFCLAATAFGDVQRCQAGVLIVGAMGVEQHYYKAFAQDLAARGFWVATFDYRGMGASRPATHQHSLRGFDADVRTWAQRDCAAMVAWMAGKLEAGAKPLLWVGHSLGGQIFGLVPNRQRVSAMLTVASGSGYWLQNAWRVRWMVWWFWWVLVPLLVPLYGYFPGRAIKKVGDLPKGVIWQWRRWCLHRDYVLACEGEAVREAYAQVRVPILSMSFSDDELMSARSIEALHGFYAQAPCQLRKIKPKEVGQGRIGHFGFFRRRFASTLWDEAAQWLATHQDKEMV